MTTNNIKHAFTSGKSDGEDTTVVRPSNWNDAHVDGSGNPIDLNSLGGSSFPSGTYRIPVLVEDSGALTSSTTYTFEDLDGDTDEEYLLEFALKVTGSNPVVTVQPNGITSPFADADGAVSDQNNRYGQNSHQDSGFVVADYIWGLTNPYIDAKMNIKSKSGVWRRSRCDYQAGDTGELFVAGSAGIWKDDATNITSLVVELSTGTFAGHIKLYKMVDLVIS